MKEIVDLMNAWNKVKAAVDTEYPNLSEEERYKICESIMFKQLGI